LLNAEPALTGSFFPAIYTCQPLLGCRKPALGPEAPAQIGFTYNGRYAFAKKG